MNDSVVIVGFNVCNALPFCVVSMHTQSVAVI